MEGYFLAVDLGTSFIKAGIYDMNGYCKACAQEMVKAQQTIAGSFIQSGEMLLEGVMTCMRRCQQEFDGRKEQIAAVVFTGQMAGFMGTDENWNDITSWSCSLDMRYLPWAKAMTEIYQGHIGEITGTCAPLMAPKIEWFRQSFPREAQKISKYMMISSYVLGKLGGCEIDEAVIDDSLIGWTGLADIRKRKWAEEICNTFNIDRKLLPKIVPSDSICAWLSDEAANATGLLQGTPLVIGAGDKVAGCIGAGATGMGNMIFEAGSYGGFSCLVQDYRRNETRNYYDVICCPEGFLAHKYIPGSGMTLRWFLEQFVNADSFSEIEEKASRVDIGCGGVMAIGLLGGSAMPFDSYLRGMWMGFDWTHGPEHFYRALLESYSYDLALTIDSVEDVYPELSTNKLIMTGGGAKSGLWGQMIADVTGKYVYRKRKNDASLWGAVLLAQKALGMKRDLSDCLLEEENVQVLHVPDEKRYVKYQDYKNRYESYRAGLHDYFAELAERTGGLAN